MPFNLYAIDDNLLDALKIEKFVIDNNQYDIPTFVVTVGK